MPRRYSKSPRGASADERFLLKVIPSDSPERYPGIGRCDVWTAGVTEHGYGVFWDGHRFWKAHRYAWTIEHGPIPGALDVLHRCDNPPCVRTAHLFLGTAADNVADMFAKGRGRRTPLRGSSNGRARLTWESVTQIRERARLGETRGGLAAQFGVSKRAIQFVVEGTTWQEGWRP